MKEIKIHWKIVSQIENEWKLCRPELESEPGVVSNWTYTQYNEHIHSITKLKRKKWKKLKYIEKIVSQIENEWKFVQCLEQTGVEMGCGVAKIQIPKRKIYSIWLWLEFWPVWPPDPSYVWLRPGRHQAVRIKKIVESFLVRKILRCSAVDLSWKEKKYSLPARRMVAS